MDGDAVANGLDRVKVYADDDGRDGHIFTANLINERRSVGKY